MCNTACDSARAEDARRAKVGLLPEATEEELLQAEEASAEFNMQAFAIAAIVAVATICLACMVEPGMV